MNDKLKFRVWDGTKFVIEPRLAISLLNFPYEFTMVGFGKVIQQYTGINDSDGKEIYEGDIVLEEWEENDPYGYSPDEYRKQSTKYIVKYKAPEFVFNSPILHEQRCIQNNIRKIIGNIYETPQLIKNCEHQSQLDYQGDND